MPDLTAKDLMAGLASLGGLLVLCVVLRLGHQQAFVTHLDQFGHEELVVSVASGVLLAPPGLPVPVSIMKFGRQPQNQLRNSSGFPHIIRRNSHYTTF